jgi:HNH endonuclease
VKTETECWEWRGCKYRNGYGVFGGASRLSSNKWRNESAHRFSFILHFGPIPAGLHVCHKCDNKICVNPSHLWLGTAADNMHDKLRKGRDHNQRKTHCKRGHPFSGGNLKIDRKGSRQCRICARDSTNRSKARYRLKLKRLGVKRVMDFTDSECKNI